MILLPGLLRSDTARPLVNLFHDDFKRPDAQHQQYGAADNFKHGGIIVPRLPGFVGPTYADFSRPVSAQETINLFPEKVEAVGETGADTILRKVPGKRPFAQLSDGPIRGEFSKNGLVFVVAGVSLFELQEGQLTFANGAYSTSWVRIGTVLSDDYMADMETNGAGGNQLFIVSGGAGYICSIVPGTGRTLTRIGGGFPGGARRAAFLNGYFYTMSGIFIYASNLEDGLTWSAASKFQRSTASDDLQSIVVDEHKILWLIGERTSEPLYDAGLTPFPMTPVQNSFMGHGTPARDSVTRFDNTVFALGQNETGGRYAYIIANGQSAQRISTHAIENAWRGYARVDDAIAWTYSEMGHSFVVLTFPTANATWVYDASVQMWHRMGHWNSVKGRYEADLASCHCFGFGRHLVGARDSQWVYEQSLDIYSDNGQAIRWLRRAPHLTKDRTWLRFDSFELIAEVGQGDEIESFDDAFNPLVSLTYSDDGGYTWASQRTRELGKRGEYRTRPIWNRLGRSLDRVFEVNGTSQVKTTLIDALIAVR